MEMFYNKKIDTIYLVPHRNGSSYFNYLAGIHDSLESLGQSDSRLPMSYYYNHTISVLLDVFKLAEYKDSKILILYRDPLVRYKSGLSLVSAEYIHDIQKKQNAESKPYSDRLLYTLGCDITGSVFPDFSLRNNHTAPAMVISLLCACVFPDRTGFLHISKLTQYTLANYRILDKQDKKTRADTYSAGYTGAEQASSSAEADFSIVSETWNNKIHRYFIETWLGPERKAYEYIASPDAHSYENSLAVLSDCLDFAMCITKCSSVLANTLASKDLLPPHIAEKIQDNIDCLGDDCIKFFNEISDNCIYNDDDDE